MNNLIKASSKILMAVVLAITLLAPAATTHAAATFNTSPTDFATFRAGNASRNTGTFNWSTSVSAAAGETIEFIIFFHNTSNETAVNTRVRSELPSSSFSSVTIFGDVFAQNANIVSNGVTVNLSSSQTLAFVPSSVRLFNSSANSVAIPFGQSGSEIFSDNGLRVGDIAPGDGGTVTFRAVVSQQAPQQIIQQGFAPIVTTQPATSIGQNSAVLNGTVNPNGANTEVRFEWGTTQALGFSTNSQSVGSGTNPINFSSFVSNLPSNTTIFFRAKAENQFGEVNGSILSFTTGQQQQGFAPFVTTQQATNIGQNSATLNGTVNPNGANTDVRFEWGTTQSLGFSTNSQNVGSGTSFVNFNSFVSNLPSNTVIFFRAVAQNSFGTVQGSILSFTTGQFQQGQAPFVTTQPATNITQNSAVLNGFVNPNNSLTTAWFEWGTTFSLGFTTGFQNIGSGSGSVNVIASLPNLSPNTTYFYRIVAQNSFGTAQGSIVSFTTQSSAFFAPAAVTGSPRATTVPATFINQNSALLNGTSNPNGSFTSAWFEWGLSTALGNRTNTQSIGQGSTALFYSSLLSNLLPNTTYFFKAVSQNAFGTVSGDILSFRTAGFAPAVSTAPSVTSGQVAGISTQRAADVISLSPSIDNINPGAGDEITYTLVYRNTGRSSVNDAELIINLPDEVEYISSSLQPSSVVGNNIIFNLGTISSQEQGIISIKSKISRSADAGDELVFLAVLNYSDTAGRLGSAESSSSVTVKKGASFAASLLDVIGDLFGNWLFDILLGLVVGFGIYHFFVRSKEKDLVS